MANKETVNSVPYLTHLDYVKGIKELTEIADYISLNIANNTVASGIKQYYHNMV